MLGVAVGGSLQRVLGVWGSGFVLLALLVIGLVLLTGTTVRAVAGRASRAIKAAGAWFIGLFEGLFRIGSSEPSADETIDLRDDPGVDRRNVAAARAISTRRPTTPHPLPTSPPSW